MQYLGLSTDLQIVLGLAVFLLGAGIRAAIEQRKSGKDE